MAQQLSGDDGSKWAGYVAGQDLVVSDTGFWTGKKAQPKADGTGDAVWAKSPDGDTWYGGPWHGGTWYGVDGSSWSAGRVMLHGELLFNGCSKTEWSAWLDAKLAVTDPEDGDALPGKGFHSGQVEVCWPDDDGHIHGYDGSVLMNGQLFDGGGWWAEVNLSVVNYITRLYKKLKEQGEKGVAATTLGPGKYKVVTGGMISGHGQSKVVKAGESFTILGMTSGAVHYMSTAGVVKVKGKKLPAMGGKTVVNNWLPQAAVAGLVSSWSATGAELDWYEEKPLPAEKMNAVEQGVAASHDFQQLATVITLANGAEFKITDEAIKHLVGKELSYQDIETVHDKVVPPGLEYHLTILEFTKILEAALDVLVKNTAKGTSGSLVYQTDVKPVGPLGVKALSLGKPSWHHKPIEYHWDAPYIDPEVVKVVAKLKGDIKALSLGGSGKQLDVEKAGKLGHLVTTEGDFDLNDFDQAAAYEKLLAPTVSVAGEDEEDEMRAWLRGFNGE